MRTSYSPELIAKYTEFLLKKGTKVVDDNELEKKLSDCVCDPT
jgi:hypothetical protein